MRQFHFSANHPRITQAKLSRTFTPGTVSALRLLASFALAAGLAVIVTGHWFGLSFIGGGLMIIIYAYWLKHGLLVLPKTAYASSTELAEVLPADFVVAYQPNLSALDIFNILVSTWDGAFMLQRYLILSDDCRAILANATLIHQDLWLAADEQMAALELVELSNAVLMVALFAVVPELQTLITTQKLTFNDFQTGAGWAHRLGTYLEAKRPVYGGIARDWAAGFTPMLSRFGTNLSQQVEFAGKFFQLEERTNQLDALVTQLSNGGQSVVLVGDPGIGKTALLLALADRILQGVDAGPLTHHQVVALNASVIISEASAVGSVEGVVMSLLNEAIRARNIVIALDEAQLFFGQGVGAVNLSQVLLQYLQSRSLVIVLAITPGDWQKLKATNQALASLLTPLVLSEPSQAEVMQTLADRSLLMNGTVTYEALLEAYRLSGRYLQEEAYPGRALKLLEASLNYSVSGLITASSVEAAVEAQFGVKVGTASAAESDVLLGMEDKIHERMINQTRAVSVVANALRRARAGVANPRRPIGSFLFLGPTGVGKTELARSLAAIYFGDEASIIRLDMSEYQQIADVDRILADATTNPDALLPKIRSTPFSVVLFDEIEKAHPNVLNLFLQLLDEGSLTDLSSRPASFKDAIIIATSNAGADEIRQRIEQGQELEQFETEFTDNLINSGQFKPELLNRFDEIVLFRPLKPEELIQVVEIMLKEVNATLEPQQISVQLTPEAMAQLVNEGYDPRLGARPMRRMVTRRVEDAVAGQILRGQAKPGDIITLDVDQLATSNG